MSLVVLSPLRFRGGQYVRSSSGRIEFPHVRLEHAGIYQCKMTNPQGGTVMSNTASLRVGTTQYHPHTILYLGL